MRWSAILWVGLASICIGGCGRADAEELDGKNPLACVVVFEEYSGLAKNAGRWKESLGYKGREQWYIFRLKAIPEKERNEEVIDRLLAKLRASGDGGLSVATDCTKREDADPDWQAQLKNAHSG